MPKTEAVFFVFNAKGVGALLATLPCSTVSIA